MINIKELKKHCDPSYLTIRNDKIIINNKRLARLSKDKIEQIEQEFNIPIIYSRKYEEISQRIGRYISKHQIISPKDHIIVGLSGGKDSLALLHLLEPYRRKYGIKIYAITVDLNIENNRPWSETNKNMDKVINHCKNLNIPHKIIGYDQDVVQMSKILSENTKGIEYSPCFSCSVVRRHVLTNFARELFEKEIQKDEKIDENKIKICFGHTLEDNSDTILANILKGDVIRTLEPLKRFHNSEFDYGKFKVKLQDCILIRPLLSVSEKDILKALNECDLDYYHDKNECPYSRENGDGIRKKCHEVLGALEKDVKNIREMVISSALSTIEHYKKEK
ncbi:tRNA lysidine(34) synthetase [Methanococcus aeolicus]|uniref:PP-loop domain protein n=1 Tax=Methanococcus aeolicus (strain ATCC BAA-1280 / DSM 17508 / OCM 812 / Nankai-3) TaxID=419665 RepID=A6UV58_META3|nr:tRNA 2-thiocytidine biosynthesis TtcA family protein [Methanococcus aeolicus]ABR56380.1 PP-loop domain protein [Methanococcus aeolicus Nankai-3]UXM84380.1 tRNA 2-thiocytidine biosynthesis TtcA family protein [Methanococcus aeolicus]